ncbi:type I restriction-modification system, S subunit, EcoA family protein [Stutzerimonas stutzeri TS44]|nr:type I restriction-modification system, S subunit, EcoA family protein [Stutzerimonas stutzeri TS44]
MSQCVADSLRETPIGAVTSDWEMGVIGDFVSALQAGVSVNAVETDFGCAEGELGVLKSSAVLQGRFYANQHKVVVAEDVGRVATSVVADRIIISRMNTPALVGESGYVTKDEPNLFLPDRLWQTEPSERPHSQRWLSYWLQHPGVRRLIAVGATGTSNSMKNISKETVLSLPVPRTPLSEQQKIAAILTAVDDKLDVIARQIEVTQALKQGLMQTLFSRGVGTQEADGHWASHTEFKDSELGEIPSAWMVTTVGEVCEVKGGKRLPKGETLTEENTGHPYIRVTDMFMGGVDTAGILYVPSHVQPTIARYTISKDDIFISVAGTLGLVGIVPEELDGANLTENADKLTDIKINRDYLFYCLCSDAIQDLIAREATSNAQPKLALTRIREFSFPLPSDEEQARIATILASVDGKLRLLSTKREKYSSLKRGLMQKLLTGEWRVRLDGPISTT